MSKKKGKEVALEFDPKKPIDREALIGGLQNLAAILRKDPSIGKLSISVAGARTKHYFDLI